MTNNILDYYIDEGEERAFLKIKNELNDLVKLIKKLLRIRFILLRIRKKTNYQKW